MHVLYRFYNSAGELLYVGITNNPPRRFGKHRDEKSWWDDIARIELQHYASRDELREAERYAIQTEQPLHNIRMNGSRHRDLVWECDVCNRPVSDGDGYVTVSYRELGIYRRAVEAWEARIAAKYPGPFRCYPFSEMQDLPQPVGWKVLHASCDPNPDSDDYWFDVEDVRTYQDVLDTSAHLFDKEWIRDTTWASIMRRAAA